jgi:hypothetical protein
VTPTSWTETLDPNTTRTQTFTIENQGTGRLYLAAITETVPWLSLRNDPTPVWMQPGNTATFQVDMYATNQTEIRNTILTVESNDPDQSQIEIPITMKVGILDAPPTIRINAPTEATVTDEIQFEVTASDDVGVIAIAAYIHGTWQTQNCSGQMNCSAQWTFTEPVPGTYSYLARAQDTIGQWSNTSEHAITLLATNTERDVRIVEYTVPTTITPGTTVPMSAIVDNHGTRRETTQFTVTLNTTILYQESIPLNPGETFTHTWQWTASDTEGSATLRLAVEPLPGETETEDNQVTIVLQIGDTSPSFVPVIAIASLAGITALLWYRIRK